MLRIIFVLKVCLRSNCAKTFCSALRTLGCAAAVFSAGAFAVSGDARAVPFFLGGGGGAFAIDGLRGTLGEFNTSNDHFAFFSLPDTAFAEAVAAPGPFPTGFEVVGAGGSAPKDFAHAGAFAAAAFVLEPPVAQSGFVEFLATLVPPRPGALSAAPILVADMGASVIFDFILAVIPGDELISAPEGMNGFYYDPNELFEPDEILFSCAASNLNPGGCDDLAFSNPFSASFNGLSTLVAVSTIQGMTEGRLPDRGLPVSAPPALALIGLGLLGLGGIRRIRSAR